MNPTLLSDVESPYGEDARRGEVVAFVLRRPLPPAERWRRAVEYAFRDAFLNCGGDVSYGDRPPGEEESPVFPRPVDPDE